MCEGGTPSRQPAVQKIKGSEFIAALLLGY